MEIQQFGNRRNHHYRWSDLETSPGQFPWQHSTFDSFLHAVSEQGQTNILSNPKLSVLNGQPALMTVGRNVTYIDKITSDTDGTTGTVTYTAETARALSGVGLALTANILDDNEIILNLVPVTSELVEPIEYRANRPGGSWIADNQCSGNEYHRQSQRMATCW